MTSLLPFIKRSYYKYAQQPLNEKHLFTQQNIQRCGKQLISIMVSSSLIKSQRVPSNRDVSSAYKKFEQQLIKKMKVSKKQAYKIFGQYCLQQLTSRTDQKCLQIQLAMIFFRELDIVSKSKAEPSGNFKKPIYVRQTEQYFDDFVDGRQKSKIQGVRIGTSSTIQDKYFRGLTQIYDQKTVPTLTPNPAQIQLPNKPKSTYKEETPTQASTFKGSVSTKITETKFSSLNQNYINSQTIDDGGFKFQLTQKDLQKKNENFSCQDYFIDVVGYLLKLPSPQGELTYIWQHLKWQGFETYYEPFMNEALEWTCTARIIFPPGMYTEKYMQRTKMSKNKKKARQMACMDLLKSLYLQYPQVWMLYKHLKEQKRLVIAAVDQPKDQEEIALIKNRDKYKINKQKVEKLFKHNITDIREMMERISAKAELNTLLQQLPGRVTSPKLQKKPVQGNWLVPVRIEYKTYNDIQNNRAPKIYEKTIVFHNTKIAEEQAYMQAIIELYQQNPELFEKIQSIKLAKGIRQPQKKLPLMRTLRDPSRQWAFR